MSKAKPSRSADVRLHDLRPTVACHPLCTKSKGCIFSTPRYKACPEKAALPEGRPGS